MRNIQVATTVNDMSKDILWKSLMDIASYPKYVPFLTKAYLEEPLHVGSTWFDVTRILWIPMKFQHKTLTLKENEEMSFAVLIPFGGKMEQRYFFRQEKDALEIVAQAEFHLGNRIIHAVVGPILQRRLYTMMQGALENISEVLPHTSQ